jgi:hypothetical protein
MGLTLAAHNAVTKTIATRYRRADWADKGEVVDELCATAGWRRNDAPKALEAALWPTIVKTRRPRPPKYGPKVVAAPVFFWAILGIAGAIGKGSAA